MITKRTKNKVEWEYDTITKKYYNHFTSKWIKNPRYQKGQAIGLAKGKAIGKAKGKAIGLAKGKAIGKAIGLAKGKAVGKMKGKMIGLNKDKSYIKKYNSLKKSNSKLHEPTFVLPFHLTDEILNEAMFNYKIQNERYKDFKYDIEECKLLISIIIVKRNSNKIRNRKHKINYDKKYTDIRLSELRSRVRNEVDFYINALLDNNIIFCDNKYANFKDFKKALGYMINDKYFKKQNEIGVIYRREDIKNWRLKKKALQEKVDNRNKHKKIAYELSIKTNLSIYETLVKYVIELIDEIDINEIRDFYMRDIYSFYDIDNPTMKGKIGAFTRLKKRKNFLYFSDFILYLKELKEGKVYFNVKDEFGERFHSPFTNITKKIRQFINYENDEYEELDIVNSQMSFFSLILTNKEILNIIPEHSKAIKEIQKFKEKEDIKLFVEKSLNGGLYEWIQKKIGYKTRNIAKSSMFHILFSENDKYIIKKQKFIKIMPNIINICNHYNTNYNKMIPRLCQLLESRIMIKGVANEFSKKCKYPFYTVHDSIGFHNKEKELAKQAFYNGFKNYKLKQLKIK